MKFNLVNIRSMPQDVFLDIDLMARSTLILIKHDGSVQYGGKYKAPVLENFNPDAGDILLFSWVGNYSTDVFSLTRADVEKYYTIPKKERDEIHEKQKADRKAERLSKKRLK